MFKHELMAMLFLLVFFTVLEFTLYTRHQKSTLIQKINYTVVDMLHNTAILFNIYMAFWFVRKIVLLQKFDASSVKKLLFLNSYVITTLVLFLILKRCFLTVFANKVLNIDQRSLYIPVMQRIPNLLNGTYTNRYVSEKMEHNLWLSGNTMNFIALVVFNLYAMFNLK